MKKVSCVLILVMLTLLQCAECLDVGDCFDKARKALTNMRLKLDEADDGSLSVKQNVTGLKTGCPYVRMFDRNDCRCLIQENIRTASVVDKKDLEMLEFLELLNTDTQIATACKIQNNVNCSAAADKIFRFKFPEATNLENGLRKHYRTCADRAKQVVPGCQSFIDSVQPTNSSETVMQEGDAAQKTCCEVLSEAALGGDCLCLILEDNKANPNAPKPAIEKQMIEVLKFVNADEGRIRDCVSKTQKLDCSGVVKALKRASDLRSLGNADNVLSDPKKCDEAAVEAMKMCGSKLDGMGPANAEMVETLVCCNEFQRIGGAGCGCSLGNSVRTSRDVVGFLEGLRSSGDKLVKSCPGFKLDGVLGCPKSNATDNEDPKLFEKCELDAQEAIKTCGPIASWERSTSCCPAIQDLAEAQCACGKFRSKVVKTLDSLGKEHGCTGGVQVKDNCSSKQVNQTMCLEKFKATKGICPSKRACCPPGEKVSGCVKCESQTMSCCQQLAALSTSPTNVFDSCLCKMTRSQVAGRTNTVPFLKAHALRNMSTGNADTSAVLQTCEHMLKTKSQECVPVSVASGSDPRLGAYLYQQDANARRMKWKLTH